MRQIDRNPARQVEAIGEVEETFTDHLSGSSRTERTALTTMLRHARRGDTVRVASMDRLARSVVDLAAIVTELTGRGVRVEFVTERLSFNPGGEDAFATFQLHLLGTVAQLERSLIRERQREGIALATERGVYRGRARRLDQADVVEARRLTGGCPRRRSPATWGAHAGCSTTPWPPPGVPRRDNEATMAWAMTVDCTDADCLGRFWATALGYVPAPPPIGWESWQQWFDDFEVAEHERSIFAALVDPGGAGPSLSFLAAPEPKTVKNRLHLDLKVGGGRHVAWEQRWPRVLTEVQRLVAAGGRVIEQVDHDGRGDHMVMGDPEGQRVLRDLTPVPEQPASRRNARGSGLRGAEALVPSCRTEEPMSRVPAGRLPCRPRRIQHRPRQRRGDGPGGAAMTGSHATLGFEREIDAPPAQVWAAYADLERRCRWLVPEGESLVYERADFTVGGEDVDRCGPPGHLDTVGTNRYHLIEAERRLLYSDVVHHRGQLLAVALVLWEIEDLGGRTRLSVSDQVTSLVGQDMIDGHRNGYTAALDQLAEWIKTS